MTVAVVTGATGGIGRWIALGLARAGYHVVLLGRNRQTGAEATAWIAGLVPAASLGFELVDLSSLAATRALGQRLAATHPRIAVLVNNAGMFSATRQLTSEGHDAVLATNHLSPHVLTHALLPSLRAASPSRVVNVGSSSSDRARVDPDNLELHHGWGMARAYSQSKLALMMTTFAWARRLADTGITANVVHPGLVATKIVRAGGVIGLAWRLMSVVKLTEEQGADTPLYACTAPDLAAVTGVYLKRRRVVAPNALALDAALVERVWVATERLAGEAPAG